MIKFSKILESNQIMYLKQVQDHDECTKSTFTYTMGKNIGYDKYQKESSSHSIDIIYSEIEGKHGDKVYLTITFDDYEDFYIYPYKNIFDAFGKALELWRDRSKKGDYSIKIIEDFIGTEIKYTNYVFNNNSHFVYANCFHDKEEFFNIAPELAKKDKIKNMLLSDRTITKFNL